MPNEIVKVVGDNLRRLRAEKGQSLSELARSSGVAKATLSALEGGRGNPTLETMSAIAAALQIPMGDLITAADPAPVQVVRSDEGTDIPGTANDLRLIARFTPGGTVEVYEASWPRRSTRNAGGHGPGTREHVFVTRGGLKVGPLGPRGRAGRRRLRDVRRRRAAPLRGARQHARAAADAVGAGLLRPPRRRRARPRPARSASRAAAAGRARA